MDLGRELIQRDLHFWKNPLDVERDQTGRKSAKEDQLICYCSKDQLICYCSNLEKRSGSWPGKKGKGMESVNQFQDVKEIETVEPGN